MAREDDAWLKFRQIYTIHTDTDFLYWSTGVWMLNQMKHVQGNVYTYYLATQNNSEMIQFIKRSWEEVENTPDKPAQ